MLLSKLLCHTINKHFPQRALGLFNKLDFARLPHVSGSLFAESPGTELFSVNGRKVGEIPGNVKILLLFLLFKMFPKETVPQNRRTLNNDNYILCKNILKWICWIKLDICMYTYSACDKQT
jgi:hypothetical protein